LKKLIFSMGTPNYTVVYLYKLTVHSKLKTINGNRHVYVKLFIFFSTLYYFYAFLFIIHLLNLHSHPVSNQNWSLLLLF